jgi:hypothetical protein
MIRLSWLKIELPYKFQCKSPMSNLKNNFSNAFGSDTRSQTDMYFKKYLKGRSTQSILLKTTQPFSSYVVT